MLADAEDLKIIRLMDEIYLEDPCLGTRRLPTVLERDHGLRVNRKRLQRLRREMGNHLVPTAAHKFAGAQPSQVPVFAA